MTKVRTNLENAQQTEQSNASDISLLEAIDFFYGEGINVIVIENGDTKETIDRKFKDLFSKVLNLGNTYMTRGIKEAVDKNDGFMGEIKSCLEKQSKGIFTDMEYEEDRKLNELAIKTGQGRILTDFITSQGKIWVITEQAEYSEDNITTILFPEEY